MAAEQLALARWLPAAVQLPADPRGDRTGEGCNPQELTNVDSASPQATSIDTQTTRHPTCSPFAAVRPWPQYAVWEYINRCSRT